MRNVMFCENDECRVFAYLVSAIGVDHSENCPGCGQFGRIKGKQ